MIKHAHPPGGFLLSPWKGEKMQGMFGFISSENLRAAWPDDPRYIRCRWGVGSRWAERLSPEVREDPLYWAALHFTARFDSSR